MATMSNNFGADRSLTATTSAPAPGPAPFGGLDAALLSKLVAMKMGPQQAAPQQEVAQAAPQQQPAYVPQLGSSTPGMEAKQAKVVNRTVKDPRANPFYKMMTGQDIPDINEKGYVDDNGRVQWEYDSIRPSGSSGGIIGGGMNNPSGLHSTENLQAQMPAARTGSGEAGGYEGGPAPKVPSGGEAGGGAATGATQTDTGYTKDLQAQQKAKNQKDVAEGRRTPSRSWDF